MEYDLKNSLQELRFILTEATTSVNRVRLNVLRGKESCRPGCNACCKRLVRITIGHAILIHERLEKNGEWDTVRVECEKIRPILGDVSALSYFRMNIECPLLKDGQCSVYDLRPAQCSTHLVTSDPKLCDPWTTEAGDYEVVDMDAIRSRTEEKIDEKFSARGILGHRLPIPTALLFAARVRRFSMATSNQLIRILNEEFR